MQRVREDFFGVSLLDYLTQIHHRNAIRYVLDHRKIMRDEQVRQIESLLELAKEVQNLRLDRNIESRNCFIAHDEFRFERKRPGDADPLALTSREFMRVTVGMFSAETNEIEQLGYAFSRAHWGRGYATEVAREAIRVAFEVLELDGLVAQTTHANAASQKVMEKLEENPGSPDLRTLLLTL